ncbi:MAG: hypothetical protein NTV88_00280 [Candidatus Micrarchaeota archaeon]|nr:hypothetical protein [Candidatus Micrarchaeota archaeon]
MINLLGKSKNDKPITDFSSASQFNNEKLVYSKSLIKESVEHHTRLRLEVAREVVSYIVDKTNFPAGNYKINFVPTDSGKYNAFDPAGITSDTIGFRLYRDQDIDLSVAYVRHKYHRTRVEKLMGAKLYAEPDHAEPEKVIAKIDAMDKGGFSDEAIKDLCALRDEMDKWMRQRDLLMQESCVTPACISKMDEVIAKMDAAAALRKEMEQPGRFQNEIPEGVIIGVALTWPIGKKSAHSFAECYPDQEELKNWIYNPAKKTGYALALNRAIGVGELEHQSEDQFWELQRLVERIESGVGAADKAAFQDSLCQFIKGVNGLIKLTSDIDDALKLLLQKVKTSNSSPPECFELICGVAEQSKEIIYKLGDLYVLSEQFKNYPHGNNIKKMIASIAANLSPVSNEQSGLARWLANNENFAEACDAYTKKCKTEMENYKHDFSIFSKNKKAFKDRDKENELRAKWKGSKTLQSRMLGFCDNGAKEASAISDLVKNAKNSKEESKLKIDALDTEIDVLIKGMENSAPALAWLLSDVRESHKEHTNYKRKSQLDKVKYYATPIDQAIYRSLVEPGRDHVQFIAERLENDAGLYRLCEKYGLKGQIIGHLGMERRLQKTPSDLESYATGQEKSKVRGQVITVPYWVGLDEATKDQKMYFEVEGHLKSVPMPSPNKADDGKGAGADFIEQKDLAEVLYGRQMPMDFVLGKVNAGSRLADKYNLDKETEVNENSPLALIFEQAFEISNKDWPIFETVKKNLYERNLKTSHFAIFLADEKELLAGWITNKLGENLPKIIGKQDDMMLDKIVEFYPNFMEKPEGKIGEWDETQIYLQHKVATNLSRFLNRSLPYWALRCAEEIEKQSRKP